MPYFKVRPAPWQAFAEKLAAATAWCLDGDDASLTAITLTALASFAALAYLLRRAHA
jgi:hypothetical protein